MERCKRSNKSIEGQILNITCFKINMFWWPLEFYYAKLLPYTQMTISNNKTRSTMQKARKRRSSCQLLNNKSKYQWENAGWKLKLNEIKQIKKLAKKKRSSEYRNITSRKITVKTPMHTVGLQDFLRLFHSESIIKTN